VLHVNRCTYESNVTLKIDTDLLREARILAAEEGSSISALLAARLEEAVRERKGMIRPAGAPWLGCEQATI